MTINADNNAKHLPEQYRFLLQQLLSDIPIAVYRRNLAIVFFPTICNLHRVFM